MQGCQLSCISKHNPVLLPLSRLSHRVCETGLQIKMRPSATGGPFLIRADDFHEKLGLISMDD